MAFARFMSSPLGRALRVVAGLALALVGLWFVGGTGGWALALVGAVPLVAGLFNFCLFAPLFGGPFLGSRLIEQP
jgi:Inner membrane protein YgaP-like, transmembrane domain